MVGARVDGAFVSTVKTRTRTFLPDPFGSGVVPRPSARPRWVDPEAHGQLDGLVELGLRELGQDVHGLGQGIVLPRSAAWTALR